MNIENRHQTRGCFTQGFAFTPKNVCLFLLFKPSNQNTVHNSAVYTENYVYAKCVLIKPPKLQLLSKFQLAPNVIFTYMHMLTRAGEYIILS